MVVVPHIFVQPAHHCHTCVASHAHMSLTTALVLGSIFLVVIGLFVWVLDKAME